MLVLNNAAVVAQLLRLLGHAALSIKSKVLARDRSCIHSKRLIIGIGLLILIEEVLIDILILVEWLILFEIIALILIWIVCFLIIVILISELLLVCLVINSVLELLVATRPIFLTRTSSKIASPIKAICVNVFIFSKPAILWHAVDPLPHIHDPRILILSCSHHGHSAVDCGWIKIHRILRLVGLPTHETATLLVLLVSKIRLVLLEPVLLTLNASRSTMHIRRCLVTISLPTLKLCTLLLLIVTIMPSMTSSPSMPASPASATPDAAPPKTGSCVLSLVVSAAAAAVVVRRSILVGLLLVAVEHGF